MYTHGHTVETRKLPQNLLDALRAFEASALLPELKPAYVKLKRAEWDAHMRHLSPWERETTLDV
jgi:glutamine synthetase